MDTKHTPGPWRIDVNGSEGWSVDYDGPSSTYMTICGDRPQPVCFVVEPSAYEYDEQIEANARLIAAAPCLLEALKVFGDLVDTVEKTFPNDPVSAGQVCRGSVSFKDFQNARDAVKKATQP